jgi:SAM-dependent methyltransferase
MQEDAIVQKPGFLKIELHPKTGHLYNAAFQQELISYDEKYNTVNPYHLTASIDEFSTLLSLLSGSLFVDIGCGQGEFVEFLRSRGEEAIGFDPVCRNPKDFLFPRLFIPEENLSLETSSRIVFVMRCVLPHIPNPFDFIEKIQSFWPNAVLVLQHQRLEYFEQTTSWNALMHDHVNYFLKSDFQNQFDVLQSSEFANEEWQQIVLNGKLKKSRPAINENLAIIDNLMYQRELHLGQVRKFRDLFIFGAAGKGINFAYACRSAGIRVSGAIDDNPDIIGRFLEGSGVPVYSPHDRFVQQATRGLLVVMNHRHLEYARNKFRSFERIESMKTLGDTDL